MSRKHDRTLADLFATPTKANVRWDDAVALLRSLGASIRAGKGSMFGVRLNGVYAVFHRPHPGGEMPKGMVERLRDYLVEAGVGP